MKAELIFDSQLTLGEGPVWNDQQQTLHCIDIMEKRLYTFNPEEGTHNFIQLDDYIGSVVLHEKDGWVAALKDGFYHIDKQAESVRKIAAPENEPSDNRFNDGKCDGAGRFLAGTLSLSNREKAGSFYSLDQDGTVKELLKDVSISNGLAWNKDGSVLYYIDTPTHRVDAFDYNLKAGELSNRRPVVEIPAEEGSPDGMTIDEEGKLWIAHYGGWQVTRWDPATGEKLDSLKVPAANVTCCTFGGPEMDELYITTAREGLSDADLAEQPSAGGVFRVKLSVKGFPPYRYKG
jgi:sugar lactone lactonase YvrE